MINVTNRPYVAVRLITIKFFFRHFLFAPCGAGALARVSCLNSPKTYALG
jgi:hypothetical protein